MSGGEQTAEKAAVEKCRYMAAAYPLLDAEDISDKSEAYSFFRRMLTKAVREDGTLHACDMRPLTHGRIEPRLLSSCWSKARRERLLVEAGTERSNDEAGKNAGRWEPYYELRAA